MRIMLMQKLKTVGLILLGFLPLCLAAGPAVTYASSAGDQIQGGVNSAAGASGQDNSNAETTLETTITTALNIISAVAGIAAVAMIIVAGARFAGSAGNENAVKGAKSAIIYAIIGIVIVATAQIMVHFVINGLITSSTTTPPSGGGGQCDPQLGCH